MIEGVREEFRKQNKRTCLVAPCGAGKTIIMAYMALQASLKGQRVLFIVHRQELIEQSSKTMDELNIRHGIIAPKFEPTNDLVQIGMVMSVARKITKISSPDLIIFDEAHHSTANTWRKIIEAFPSAFVIGLTATPVRTNGSGLGNIFNSLIIGPSVSQLVKWGNLAPFNYYAPPALINPSELRVRYGDYVREDVAHIMNNKNVIGDAIEHYKKLANGKKAVCYCAGRKHSEYTAKLFCEAGIRAVHIDGETEALERKKAIEDFRKNEIKILCNVDLISEGFDVPSMEAVILLRPTKSLTLYIQQAMRAMRADKDNPLKKAIIIDHVGNVYQHGLPDEERQWTLKPTKEKQKREVSLKVCPKCYSAHKPSKVCPYCGYVYLIISNRSNPTEIKNAQLVPIEELERKRKRQEIGRAKNIVDLETIALKRGYKLGWISKMAEIKKIPFGGN